MRRLVTEGDHEIEVDSAGTGDWHVGDLADPRARKVGTGLGCEMTMRARQVSSQDFAKFDYVIAMDHANVSDLKGWPGSRTDKIHLARSYDATAEHPEVPDPYCGSMQDFEEVGQMLELACRGLLEEIGSTGHSTVQITPPNY